MPKKEEKIISNIEITDLQQQGKGVGRDESGCVYFVQDAVPGDVLDIRVLRKKKNYSEATIRAVVKPSEQRIEPFCNHFELCGGCKIQSLNYESQLMWKQSKVAQAFSKMENLPQDLIQKIQGSPLTQYYKNKLEFSFSNRRWISNVEIESKEKVQRNGLGFHLSGKFDRIVDIKHCYLQSEDSNVIRNAVKEIALKLSLSFVNPYTHKGELRNLIIRNSSKGEWLIVVVFGEIESEIRERFLTLIKDELPFLNSIFYTINLKKNDDASTLNFEHFSGEKFLHEKLTRLDKSKVYFNIAPKSFFQSNIPQVENIYNEILKNITSLKSRKVLDLYCGVGSISLFIAPFVEYVKGIEIEENAILDAIENATLNKITNAKFECQNIISTDNKFYEEKFDTIICDPPRIGLGQKVAESLLSSGARYIIYLSCNPDTQVRDISLLQAKYKILQITPFDMFPHTIHIENLVILESIE